MTSCAIAVPDGCYNSGIGPTYKECDSTSTKLYRHPQGHHFHMCEECKARVWPELKPAKNK